MKIFFNELVVGKEIDTFFLLPETPVVRDTSRGTKYASMKLTDCTGSLDGKLWELPPGFDPEILTHRVVKVRGSAADWQGTKQFTIKSIRLAQPDEFEETDFYEIDPNIDVNWSVLMLMLTEHQGDYCKLAYDMLREHEAEFKRHPAAHHTHHALIGGLVSHVTRMVALANEISNHYPLANRDLLLAGAALHDIGKLWELSGDLGFAYTTEGSLVGHIPIGLIRVDRFANETGFSEEKLVPLLHLIASHHGKLEYGSPKTPATREAMLLHLIDMMDSQMAIFDRMEKSGVNDDGFSGWCKELGGVLYYGNKSET